MDEFSKIELKLVRSFSLGFAIHSPRLNGLYVELYLGLFHLAIWHKPEKWLGFKNYWS